jgi:hypothetical protein
VRMTTQTIAFGGIEVTISPWAFQYWAKDFFSAYESHRDQTTTKKFSPARAYLICRSIELGGKALYLAQSERDSRRSPSTPADGDPMKASAKALPKSFGHDLIKACRAAHLAPYGVVLSDIEEAELKRANAYYANKGFEYFWAPIHGFTGDNVHRSGPHLAASGYPELPDETVLAGFAARLLSVAIPC